MLSDATLRIVERKTEAGRREQLRAFRALAERAAILRGRLSQLEAGASFLRSNGAGEGAPPAVSAGPALRRWMRRREYLAWCSGAAAKSEQQAALLSQHLAAEEEAAAARLVEVRGFREKVNALSAELGRRVRLRSVLADLQEEEELHGA